MQTDSTSVNRSSFPTPADLKRNPWIAFRRRSSSARVRLFCFPYAGAGASVFRPWGDFLPQEFELCAVQLPGREERLQEEPFANFDLLVETVASQLARDL